MVQATPKFFALAARGGQVKAGELQVEAELLEGFAGDGEHPASKPRFFQGLHHNWLQELADLAR
jgi:hypothetical protein